MKLKPHIVWTSCATHCLDLMLEYIEKTKGVHTVVKKAHSITVFLYNHIRLLELMRRKFGGKDLTITGITTFTTSYLNLQSLYKNREKLKELFVSLEYNSLPWSKKKEGKVACNICLSMYF